MDRDRQRITVNGSDVTYDPVEPGETVASEVRRLTSQIAPHVNVLFATSIRRGDDTYAGLCVGPPKNLILVDPCQTEHEGTRWDLAIATSIHELGHARFTPASQEAAQSRFWKRIQCETREDLWPLYDLSLQVFEDERIELRLIQRWPELRAKLERRWQYFVEGELAEHLKGGVFEHFGPLSVVPLTRADYLYHMIGQRNWHKRSLWHSMHPDLRHILAKLRKIKREKLRVDCPLDIPALAYRFVKVIDLRLARGPPS